MGTVSKDRKQNVSEQQKREWSDAIAYIVLTYIGNTTKKSCLQYIRKLTIVRRIFVEIYYHSTETLFFGN